MSTTVEITHPDRVLFPSDGITKGDLVAYYTEIAGAMVPHLRGRPLTVWRYPRGIDQNGFVQQDFADSLPDWMGRVRVAKEDGTVVHPTADRRDALRWLANQNCVIVHAWLSKRDRLRTPDRIVFDLDPTVDDFAVVRATARTVADVLSDIGLVSYVQTTGSRGLHVVSPIKATPTSTPCGNSLATSRMWSPPTTRRTAPSRRARPSVATGCTSTSCETRTGRPRSRRMPSGPDAGRRSPLRWNGMSWAAAACVPTPSPSAMSLTASRNVVTPGLTSPDAAAL